MSFLVTSSVAISNKLDDVTEVPLCFQCQQIKYAVFIILSLKATDKKFCRLQQIVFLKKKT